MVLFLAKPVIIFSTAIRLGTQLAGIRSPLRFLLVDELLPAWIVKLERTLNSNHRPIIVEITIRTPSGRVDLGLLLLWSVGGRTRQETKWRGSRGYSIVFVSRPPSRLASLRSVRLDWISLNCQTSARCALRSKGPLRTVIRTRRYASPSLNPRTLSFPHQDCIACFSVWGVCPNLPGLVSRFNPTIYILRIHPAALLHPHSLLRSCCTTWRVDVLVPRRSEFSFRFFKAFFISISLRLGCSGTISEPVAPGCSWDQSRQTPSTTPPHQERTARCMRLSGSKVPLLGNCRALFWRPSPSSGL